MSRTELGTAETNIKPKKRRFFALVSLVIGLLFGLLLVEIALRVAGYSSPEFYAADESRGYALIPGMKGMYSKEGRSFVVINGDGFRDVEHSIEKPPGTIRIAVIGDSYVEAFQVEQSESFTNFVRDEITKCGGAGGKQVEMLNFGVSGYSTAQELITIREKVWKYSPDIVMLVMTTNNDITDNSPYFKKLPIPYFTADGVLDEGFRHDKVFLARNSAMSRLGIWLKNHIRTVQAVGAISTSIKYKYQAWKNKKPATEGQPAEPSAAATAPAADIGVDNQIYRIPSDDNWKNAWSVTEAIILEMKREVADKGVKFVVVTASNGVQVLPDVSHRTAYAKYIGVDDLLYPDRRIAEFCTSKSIPVITLAPLLGDYSARENVFLHGFEGNIGYGHWNQRGHKVAGETIGKKLCEGIVK
ncbi:MAG: SGNH/GDSL hydrolase family protein [Pyrinomonadaceae bacterium]